MTNSNTHKIKWEPQEKQKQALKSNADEILLGGSRGGGKTDAGIVFPLYYVEEPEYRALVLRKNFTDLKEWIDRAQQMYKGINGSFTNGMFKFPSGATIWLGHMSDASSYQKYQGFNIHNLIIEELTHFPRESEYEKLLGSLRSVNPKIKPQVFATTNPDGPGHEWVKERWNIPDRPGDEPITTYKDVDIGDKTVQRKLEFIPSRVYDNKYLANSDEYLSYLHSIQDEELKRAWLEGSWEGFGVEGSYYKKQLDEALKEGRLDGNFYDPLLPVYTWCDLGIGDSFAIIYAQLHGLEIRVVDYDEFDGESLGEAIKRMKEKPYTYQEHYAPFDIEVRELGSGKSRKEIAYSLGVDYQVVPRLSVDDGINAVRMRLKGCWFDKKAELLVKRLKRYRKDFDEKRGVYKNKPYHDINSHGCFGGETLVATTLGQKRIKEITTKDIVVTPNGDAEVWASGSTGYKDVYLFNGSWVTADHPYITQRGIVSLDKLRYSDRLMSWNGKQSFIRGQNSTDTLNQSTIAIGNIIGVMRREIKQHFTDINGCVKLEKFPKGITYTIRTVIMTIITYLTSSYSQYQNILVADMVNNPELSARELLKLQESTRYFGTNQKKEDSGIVKWQRSLGRIKKLMKRVARCVGINTKPTFLKDLGSALIIVRLPKGEEKKETYSLSTSKGVFLANDLVVSNSDAMRYMCSTNIIQGDPNAHLIMRNRQNKVTYK